MNSLKGLPTWEMQSRIETAKVIAANTHDPKVREIAEQQIAEFESELEARGI